MRSFIGLLLEGKLEDAIWKVHGPAVLQRLKDQDEGRVPIRDDGVIALNLRNAAYPDTSDETREAAKDHLFNTIRQHTGHTKYADNILRAYAKGEGIHRFDEDLPHVGETIQAYHRLSNLPGVDMAPEHKMHKNFRGLEDFAAVVNHPDYAPYVNKAVTPSEKADDYEVTHEGTDIHGFKFKVIKPNTPEACAKHGPSGLCTAGQGNFNHYQKLGGVQIIKSENPDAIPVQIHLPSNQIMTHRNQPVSPSVIHATYPSLDFMAQHAAADKERLERARADNEQWEIKRQIRANPEVAAEYVHHENPEYRKAVAEANHNDEHNEILMNDPVSEVRNTAILRSRNTKYISRLLKNIDPNVEFDKWQRRNSQNYLGEPGAPEDAINETLASLHANKNLPLDSQLDYWRRFDASKVKMNSAKGRAQGWKASPVFGYISNIMNRHPDRLKEIYEALPKPTADDAAASHFAMHGYGLGTHADGEGRYKGTGKPANLAAMPEYNRKLAEHLSHPDNTEASNVFTMWRNGVNPEYAFTHMDKFVNELQKPVDEEDRHGDKVGTSFVRSAMQGMLVKGKKKDAAQFIETLIDKGHRAVDSVLSDGDRKKLKISPQHMKKWGQDLIAAGTKDPVEMARNFPEMHEMLAKHPNKWVRQAVVMKTQDPKLLLTFLNSAMTRTKTTGREKRVFDSPPIVRHYVASRAIKARHGQDKTLRAHPDWAAFDAAVEEHMKTKEDSSKVLDRWNDGKPGGKTHSMG